MKAQKFYKLDNVPEKNVLLRRGYVQSALSLVGLAAIASQDIRQRLAFSSPHLMALAIAFLSASFASSVSFQYFQIPNLVSSTVFREHKAVCLSFLDGLGFVLTAPVWAMNNRMVQHYGWARAWTFLALLFGLGAKLMMTALQPVLYKHEQESSS